MVLLHGRVYSMIQLEIQHIRKLRFLLTAVKSKRKKFRSKTSLVVVLQATRQAMHQAMLKSPDVVTVAMSTSDQGWVFQILEVPSSRNELDLEAVMKVEEQRFVDLAFVRGYDGCDNLCPSLFQVWMHTLVSEWHVLLKTKVYNITRKEAI